MMPYIFLFLGLLLVFLEFYTPSGVLATGGAIFLIAAISTFIASSNSVPAAIAFVIFTFLAIFLVCRFAINRIKSSGKKNTFYLSQDQEGFQGAHFDASLIGKKGVTLTDLGPSGFILVDGKRVQATARSGYIDRGRDVEIIGGEGAHLIIKPLQ
jgi:membrane-bound ClpP family serine protease